MRLKKLGAALVVVAALGAVLASSALAAAVTEDVKWYTGASPGTELSGSETVSATAVGAQTFSVNQGGTTYIVEASGLRCVGCTITIEGGKAVFHGKFEYTTVTAEQPAGCSVPSTITTKELSGQADWMSGTTNYIKLVPTAGETTTFATIEITGCALATTINPKGSLFVQTTNATGTQAVEQEVTSSAAINTAAGGNLHVGEEPATLSGSVKLAMSGAKAGVAFGTH